MTCWRLVLLGMLVGLAGACVAAPVPLVPAGTPYAPAGDSLATLAAAQATVTAEARLTEAALLAARTQAAAVTATREAWWFAATQTQAAGQVEGTRVSAERTQAAVALAQTEAAAVKTQAAAWTAAAVQLTQGAAELRATAEHLAAERRAEWDHFAGTVARVAVVAAVVILLGLGLKGGWDWLAGLKVRRLVLETRAGTLYLGYVDRQPDALVLPKPAPALLPAESEAPEAQAPEPAPPALEEEPDPLKRLVLRLLRDAIDYEAKHPGWDQARIPDWRRLEWQSAAQWQRAVTALGDEVVRRSGAGGGTRVVARWETVLNLYYAVAAGKVQLVEPAPA